MNGASSGGGGFVGLLLGIAVVVAIFLIFRTIVLWYWKVNVKHPATVHRSIRSSANYAKRKGSLRQNSNQPELTHT